MKSRAKLRRSVWFVLPLLFLLLGATLVAFQDAPAPAAEGGPGANPSLVTTLTLPVERTFDLDHVRPEHFAAALGKDPERIFAFVRDAIAFESYQGALRGPRGTLLALAGNAADRALLLASMLQASGQRVRFAHGTLPEPLAHALVSSMWSAPSRKAVEPNSDKAPAGPGVFGTSVKQNYQLIRDQLERAGVSAGGAGSATDMSALVREAQDHVWVQWQRGGDWVDLDPSFAGAAVDRAHAAAAETLDALPDSIYHRIELRVVVEEQTGNKVAEREVLKRAARACDLSGSDLLVSHQPENWDGPASSLEGALAAAIGNTGRIKPVLIVDGKESVPGEAFPHRPSQQSGLGAVGGLLGIPSNAA